MNSNSEEIIIYSTAAGKANIFAFVSNIFEDNDRLKNPGGRSSLHAALYYPV